MFRVNTNLVDWELEQIKAEKELYRWNNDELPKAFWTAEEWNEITMYKARMRKKIAVCKEELRKEKLLYEQERTLYE